MDLHDALIAEAELQRTQADAARTGFAPEKAHVHVVLADVFGRLAGQIGPDATSPAHALETLRDDLVARFEIAVAEAAERVSAEAGKRIDTLLAARPLPAVVVTGSGGSGGGDAGSSVVTARSSASPRPRRSTDGTKKG